LEGSGHGLIHSNTTKEPQTEQPVKRPGFSLVTSHIQFGRVAGELYNSAFVSYGCETWSLTLSKDHRLRVFENRVLV